MKTIEIEEDLYKHILNNIEAFGETPSQILRRLLQLPDTIVSEEKETIKEIKQPIVVVSEKHEHTSSEENTKHVESAPTQPIESGEHFNHGVAQLFEDPAFKAESVVTNKFMMMLTTLYFEKTAAFVEAAEKTKGRTRDYLGVNLQGLLNSDNEEELAQFKASKPRMIPQTPYWVITNANTGRKRIILTQMMASMGYPHSLIERIKDEI